MKFDRPITIQKINPETEEWADLYKLHARINKSKGQEKEVAGTNHSEATLLFEIRYFKDLKDIFLNTQLYRVVFEGHEYNIIDYDDYMLQHRTVKLIGEA